MRGYVPFRHNLLDLLRLLRTIQGRLVMLGLSWGVFLAYVVGLATVLVSVIHPFIASSESWNIEKIED